MRFDCLLIFENLYLPECKLLSIQIVCAFDGFLVLRAAMEFKHSFRLISACLFLKIDKDGLKYISLNGYRMLAYRFFVNICFNLGRVFNCSYCWFVTPIST